ncbi:MAG TPA: tail fiber protein [Rhizomicrobium sp.]|nr:tail fiber protein [Rhizomicrobium sp.]
MKRTLKTSLLVLLGLIGLTPTVDAQATDPYLGQLMVVGFTFCPRGWTEANGQILSIASNTALFSLYGTTYGGNGQTTFALPDLRGRVAMHVGAGLGLPNADQGEVLGTPTTTLTVANLPAHNHSLNASGAAPSSNDPSGNLLGTFTPTQHVYDPGAPNKVMAPTAIGMTGQNIPFDQHQPSLVLRYCVALQGVFPSRN